MKNMQETLKILEEQLSNMSSCKIKSEIHIVINIYPESKPYKKTKNDIQIQAEKDLEWLLTHISFVYGITPILLNQKNRKSDIIAAKKLFIYLANYHFRDDKSLINIRTITDMVWLDHSTFYHHVKTAQNLLDANDWKFKEAYNEVINNPGYIDRFKNKIYKIE
jgi:hypothetical protein